ncbi:MAG TPA: transcriptional regulator [Acidimicrobiales bacterium]|nr:transcriptional regulator [Acidimicrobiales bacterium]
MDEELDALYRRRVGERIRVIRRQQRLSLHDVEDRSESEFKASVLGAYERGERAISVPRLQRLARFYGVPVDQLLPIEGEGESAAVAKKSMEWTPGQKIVIDLTKLSQVEGPESEMIERYLTIIQVKRQDFNGRVLTIRGDDLQALAAILGTDVDAAAPRLDEIGLLYRPDAA